MVLLRKKDKYIEYDYENVRRKDFTDINDIIMGPVITYDNDKVFKYYYVFGTEDDTDHGYVIFGNVRFFEVKGRSQGLHIDNNYKENIYYLNGNTHGSVLESIMGKSATYFVGQLHGVYKMYGGSHIHSVANYIHGERDTREYTFNLYTGNLTSIEYGNEYEIKYRTDISHDGEISSITAYNNDDYSLKMIPSNNKYGFVLKVYYKLSEEVEGRYRDIILPDRIEIIFDVNWSDTEVRFYIPKTFTTDLEYLFN